MRILIIENETRVSDFLQRGLRAEGYFCIIANDGKTGLSLALEGNFDLILLDLILPGMHGQEVCQQLRMKRINTPLIILSALDSLNEVIAGLRMGADDYLTKPFSFEELLVRIETIMRRSSDIIEQDQTLKVGPLVFDRKSLRFSADGIDIKMTPKELAIVELLMTNPGTLFSRERILNNVWGMDMDPLTNVVDVFIGKLRKKIDRDSASSIIETVRGLGYRLNLEKKV
jgi:DNA-binding response OmpR family regulator